MKYLLFPFILLFGQKNDTGTGKIRFIVWQIDIGKWIFSATYSPYYKQWHAYADRTPF